MPLVKLKLIILIFVLAVFTFAQENPNHGRIVVSANGHYLQFEDGKPFFWLGDTAWELFHRLNLEEIENYLNNRKEKGFNVIQAVVLPEMDGLRKPNQYGEVPFIDLNPEKPNEKYFELIDKVFQMAEERGMFIGLLPTWGDKVTLLWGKGPVIFNEETAYKYGSWIGKRYKDAPNVIWILGGDRPGVQDTNDWRPIWSAMAKGILHGTEDKALITYHPSGGEYSTSQYIHNEDWLDINMMQSGHGGGHDVPVWLWISRDYNLKPAKPTLDAEPNYEDHPVNPWPKWNSANGYFRDYDVRKQIYRSVFSGACGVTYGHHSIWQFFSQREEKINHADRYWIEALDRPGAFQAGYLKKLIESRPQMIRLPDGAIIQKGQGNDGEFSCSTYGSDGSYLMVYIPAGRFITVNTRIISCDTVKACWFNPKDGNHNDVGLIERKNSMNFTPPTLGFGNDWVLILDDPKFNCVLP